MKKICMFLLVVLSMSFLAAVEAHARAGNMPDLIYDESIKSCDCKLFPECCPQPVVEAPPPPPPEPVPAPPPPPPPEPVKEKVTIRLNVEFDTAKAVVKDEYNDEIKKVADFMKQYPDSTAAIEGHTDNVGNDDYNQKLSEERANSVRQYLIDKFGIDGSRLTAAGYGESKPVADNGTAEGRQQNRRVEAVLEAIRIVQ